MGKLIILACLIASSLAQEGKAVSDSKAAENPRQPGADILSSPPSGSDGSNSNQGGVGDAAADLPESVLGEASGSSPSPGVSISSSVINMLGALVSSPASMNIDDLLGSIGSGVSPSVSMDASSAKSLNNRTKVIRPAPEVVCIPLKETRPEMIETLNSSMGMPLINVGLQLSSGTSGENADLGGLLDLLEPLLRLLRPTINMLREIPEGSLGSGLLNPLIQVLQSLLTTLSERVPLGPEEITSRLLRALVLLIGFTAVGSGGNPVLSKILRGLLLSLGKPILSLLQKMDGSSGNLLQAISKTINSIGGSVEELIGQQPTVGGGGSDTGGGGLLNLVGGLLNGLLG